MDQFSSLNMAALVNLEVLSTCEMAIKVRNSSIIMLFVSGISYMLIIMLYLVLHFLNVRIIILL